MKQPSATATSQVVIVAHQYWPTPGPAASRLSALAGELTRRGMDVEVWTTGAHDVAATKMSGPNGEDIHIIFKSGYRSGVSARRLAAVLGFARAIRAQRRRRPLRGASFVSDPPPLAASATLAVARATRSSFTYYLCDSWGLATQKSPNLVWAIGSHGLRWIEKRTLRRSDAVIASTPGLSEYALASRARGVVCVLNGTDLGKFGVETPEPTSDAMPDHGPLFVYAGTAGIVHGATIFADAAEALWARGFQFRMMFVGQGVDMEELATRAEHSAGKLIVREPVPTEEMARLLRESAAALVSLKPLIGYLDARPTKAMAALATGTPLVYAGTGQFRDELEEQELGYFADWSLPQVIQALEAAIDGARMPDLQHAMRVRARDYARARFDLSVTARLAADAVERASQSVKGHSSP